MDWLVAPLVANLTDDNPDGRIDLCDVPDVVVVALTEHPVVADINDDGIIRRSDRYGGIGVPPGGLESTAPCATNGR